MVLSRTCQARLPRTLSSCGKSPWTAFSSALRWCLSHLRSFPMSQLYVDFAMDFAINLSSTSFNSVNRKTYIVHQTQKLFYPIKAENTNCSLRKTAVVFSPPHKRSHKKTPSDDQWHVLQWQQDR